MPGKRITRKYPPGPFRGPTPRNTIQTVDLGSGKGEYIHSKAEKNPHKIYAAADLIYQPGEKGLYHIAEKLREAGVRVHAGDFLELFRQMREEKVRARHINIDFPEPFVGFPGAPKSVAIAWQSYRDMIRQAPHVLLPNGKIFLLTEDPETADLMEKWAREDGLKARRIKPITEPWAKPKSRMMKVTQGSGHFYRLEITYGLKKAIPDKKKRVEWGEAYHVKKKKKA